MTQPDVPLLTRQVRRIILQLRLISHAPSQHVDQNAPSSDDDQGGRRPSGGIDTFGDYQISYRQKSAEHFARELERARTPKDLERLLKDAKQALEDWRKTPLLEGQRPARHDPRFKQWVATCGHPITDLQRWYGLTRQQLRSLQRKYANVEDT